jgi:hypothetical protein
VFISRYLSEIGVTKLGDRLKLQHALNWEIMEREVSGSNVTSIFSFEMTLGKKRPYQEEEESNNLEKKAKLRNRCSQCHDYPPVGKSHKKNKIFQCQPCFSLDNCPTKWNEKHKKEWQEQKLQEQGEKLNLKTKHTQE